MSNKNCQRELQAALKRFQLSRRRFVHVAAGAAGVLAAPAFIRDVNAATVVKLGHTQPLTGPSAPYGIRGHDGAVMAVNEINKAGGFADGKGRKYTLEMTEDDMVNDPKQAVTLIRQHVLDPKIVASMGPTNSVGFLPCIPVAGQLKLPLVGNGSGAPVKRWNAWAYRVNPVGRTALPAMMKVVAKKAGIKRLAVIYDQTQDAQAGDAKMCREYQGDIGFEVVAFEAHRAGDQDFSPQIATIKNSKPDAVFVASATGDGVKVVSQLRIAGLDQPLITGYGSFRDPVYWDGTKGSVKGGYTWLGQDIASAAGMLKDWLAQYNKTFKLEATSFSTYGYDAVWTVVECIKRTNSRDRGAIQEVLTSLKYRTPLGSTITFKNPPHGNNLTPSITVIQVTGRGAYKAIRD
jgi:branched-chain amino acid transport system substrate-binding protein